MSLRVEYMPGPSPEARALQFEQHKAYDALCEAHLKVEHEGERFRLDVIMARVDYDRTVTELVALLGDEVHCNLVDTELFGEFFDYYNDVVGLRPRQHITRQGVLTWLAEQNVPEAEVA